MSVIAFVVPGNPIPWARALESKGRRFNDPRVEAYKSSVRAHALRARQRARLVVGIDWPLDAIYALTCVVRRSDWDRCDVDRLLNACADACVGVLYEDDRHRFLRGARVEVGLPMKASPQLGVIVRVRTEAEQEAIASDLEGEIEMIGDGLK